MTNFDDTAILNDEKQSIPYMWWTTKQPRNSRGCSNMDIDIEEKCRAIKMAKAFVCLQVTCQFGKYFCLFTRQYFAGLCANLIGKSVQHAFLGRGVTSIVGLFRLEEFA